MFGLFRVNARCQTILSLLHQPAHDPLDPDSGLSFTEDDFRVTAASMPFEIDLCVAEVSNRRRRERVRRPIEIDLALAHLFQQCANALFVHIAGPAQATLLLLLIDSNPFCSSPRGKLE